MKLKFKKCLQVLCTLVAIILLLNSCKDDFENPQPINGRVIEAIPKSMIGEYSVPEVEEELEKAVIEKKSIKLIVNTKNKLPKAQYYFQNGKHYVIDKNISIEISNPIFKTDSVQFYQRETTEFKLGSNLIIKEKDKIYVFNYQTGSDNGWSILICEKSSNGYVLYQIEDKILENFKKNTKGLITENIDMDDIKYYLKRKSTYLSVRYILNTELKTINSGH